MNVVVRSFALAYLCVLTVGVRAQDVEPTPPEDVQTAPAGAAEITPADETRSADDVAAEQEPAAPARQPWPDRSRPAVRYRHGNELVSFGHDSILAQGESAEVVVSILGSSMTEGDVSDTVVAILGDSYVSGPVGDAVVAVLGDVYINSRIGGDVVAVLGDVNLGPEADVGGDVVAVGGMLNRDPSAQVRGDVQGVLTGHFGGFKWLRPWVETAALYGRPLSLSPGTGWAWGLALGFLALYVLLAVMFRDSVDRCVQTLETRPGKSMLAALLTVLLTPVLFVLLLVTLIGVIAVPFVGLALFVAGLFGKAAILAWIGGRLTKGIGLTQAHTAFAVLIGGAIALALYLVPVVGFLVYKLLGILGLGVVAYTLMLSVKRENGTSPAPAPAFAGTGAGVGAYDAPGPATGTAPAAAAFADTDAAASASAASNAAAATGAPAGSESVSEPVTGEGPAEAAQEPPPEGAAPQAQSAAAEPRGPSAASPSAASAPPPSARPVSDPALNGTLPRADFGIRMLALFLDTLLIGFLLGLIADGGSTLLLVLAAYGAVMWKQKGTTVGGIICGLKVVRTDGRPVDWSTAIVRALGCFLSLAVVGLGFFWILFDEDKQAWHDKIAGTVVVRVPKGVSLV